MSDAPFYFAYANTLTAAQQPGTIVADDTTTAYFTRSLFQRAMSVFDFTIPDSWPREYFLQTLFGYGVGVVTDTPKYGVVFQHCTLSGFSLYYQPTEAIIANPLLSKTCKIGVDCEILHLQPDFGGVLDTVQYYAVKLALLAKTIDLNICNSRLSYVFGADNQADAATFKALFDEIGEGKPAVVTAKKKMYDEHGNLRWQLFTQDVKANFIVPELLEAQREIINGFDAEIGIPNSQRKKERMIVDEVSRNDFENQARALLWLQTLQDCCKRVNAKFNIGLAVKLKEGVYDAPDTPVQPVPGTPRNP